MRYMNNWKRQEWMACVGALIGAISSQGMGLTNKYTFSDDVNLMFSSGATVSSGRGGLLLLRWIEDAIFGNGQYSLPLYNGLVAIIAIAISVGIIVSFLELKDIFLCVMLGIAFGCFPSLTALMYFDFTVHYYMIGLLLGVFCTAVALRGKSIWAKIIGVIGIGIAIGVYQAFLPVFVSLMLLDSLIMLYKQKRINSQSDLWQLIYKALVIPAGLLCYYIVNSILLRIVGEKYSGYMGIGSEFEVSIRTYILRMAVAFREFFFPASYYTEARVYSGNAGFIYMALAFVWLLLSVLQYMLNRKELSVFNRSYILLCNFCVPVSVNLIYVLSSYRIVRMQYSLVMFYVFFAYFAEQIIQNGGKLEKVTKPIAVMGMLLMCLNMIRTDNISYLKATLVQSEAIHYFNNLIEHIQSVDGYRSDYPVAFVNEDKKDTLHLIEFSEFVGLPEDPDRELKDYVNDFMWFRFMGIWCGYEPERISGNGFKDNELVKEMPTYPNDGSIRIIDDTVVVKF